MSKLIYGNGFNDGKYPATINKKITREYRMWVSMLERCYSDRFHKIRPTYIGCAVSDNFKSYSYFYEWCQKQVGISLNPPRLDKDILKKGNKIYSEDNCVLVPNEINSLLNSVKSKRGNLPIGVQYCKQTNKYRCAFSKGGVITHVSRRNTVLESFYDYKEAKESFIKNMAMKWKDKIDDRAYKALMEYTVEIND